MQTSLIQVETVDRLPQNPFYIEFIILLLLSSNLILDNKSTSATQTANKLHNRVPKGNSL